MKVMVFTKGNGQPSAGCVVLIELLSADREHFSTQLFSILEEASVEVLHDVSLL
jgi:hypothetical protein